MRYTEKCALLLLTIYHQLIGRLLSGGYVSADETTVKLLAPDRRHKAQDAWLWTYLGPTADTIVFQFSLTREAENPQTFFPKNWCGALPVDGYRVYTSLAQSLPGIVLFGCWTRARLGVVDTEGWLALGGDLLHRGHVPTARGRSVRIFAVGIASIGCGNDAKRHRIATARLHPQHNTS